MPADLPTRIAIKRVEAGYGDDLWREYVSASPDATIYHDIAWREIFRRGFGYSSIYLLATRNGRPAGALPLFRVRGLRNNERFVSVPFRDRGGPLYDDAEVLKSLLEAAKSAADFEHKGTIELKSIQRFPTDELPSIEHWIHSEVDLHTVNPSRIAPNQSPQMRNVRRGENANLRFFEADRTEASLRRWSTLYERSQRRLGVPPFPRKFFRAMLNLLGDKVRVYFVENPRGETCSGMIIFVEPNRVIYGYSASDERYQDLRPSDFMIHGLIKHLTMNTSFRYLDFGSDSPLQNGLLHFKRKWLASQKTIPVYYLGSKPPEMMDSSEQKFGTVRKIVRLMPPPLNRIFLSPLVKYFG